MATTWLKSIHKGGGIAAALGLSVDYISDSDKTNEGELIDSYECDPRTAVSEFLMSKREYEHITGRNQGNNSVNLNCDGKYQDFKRSAIALRRVSDQICIEHGLSIIKNPGLSQGRNRSDYLGEQKPKTRPCLKNQ